MPEQHRETVSTATNKPLTIWNLDQRHVRSRDGIILSAMNGCVSGVHRPQVGVARLTLRTFPRYASSLGTLLKRGRNQDTSRASTSPGDTRAARRAGTYDANTVTARRRNAAPTNAAGSSGFTRRR